MCHIRDDVARNHQNGNGVAHSNIPDLRKRLFQNIAPGYNGFVSSISMALLMKLMRLMCPSDLLYGNSMVSEHSCVCNGLHTTVALRLTAAPWEHLGAQLHHLCSQPHPDSEVAHSQRIDLLLWEWAAGSESKSCRGVPKKFLSSCRMSLE